MTAFPPGVLDRLRSVEEVRIETSAGPGRPARRTTIWVMVDDRDWVLVRSVRGERGRWYRNLRANPDCALILRRDRVEAHAELADDPDRVEAASRVLTEKYDGIPGLREMLEPDVLEATFELHPRE
jgi:hypothetical protein